MNARLTLIRGLPGSGKTTLAKTFAARGCAHFEADMFFGDDYQFEPSKLPDAHRWCQESAKAALDAGRDVVVSNTFSRVWEMQPYLSMTSDVAVIHATGRFGNVHGVPPAAIERMAARWERYASETTSDLLIEKVSK